RRPRPLLGRARRRRHRRVPGRPGPVLVRRRRDGGRAGRRRLGGGRRGARVLVARLRAARLGPLSQRSRGPARLGPVRLQPVPSGPMDTSVPPAQVAPALTVAPARSDADRFVRRLLFLDPEAPKVSILGAESAFQKSIAISAIRCLITYIALPLLRPVVDLSGGVGPVLGLVVGTVSMVAIVFAARRFFAADHK